MKIHASFLRLAAALTAAAMTACSHLPSHFVARQPVAAYAPTNFTAEPVIPAEIRRIVLLPVDRGGHATPEIARELDGILLNALQQQNRFEVVTLSRADCRRMFGAESFNSTSALPTGFTARIGGKFAADAVLFVDLTTWRSMRPLALGLRAKLARTDDAGIVWAFDEVVDAAMPEVSSAVLARYTDPKDPVSMGEASLRSPSRFGAFAATAMFSTLPQR